MTAEDDRAAAREAAMRLLARREYAVAEMVQRLRGRGHDEALAATVVDELCDEGLLSEERFVESFVRSRVERGAGPMKIEAELRQRGVDVTRAEPHLEEVDWREQARAVYHQRFGNAEPPADRREWSRRARFLQGRGFTAEQVRRVMDVDDL
ncbi:MAG: regulatory protein RecX [Pseudomonadota bacterium]